MTRPNQLTILRMVLTPFFVYTLLLDGYTYTYLACGIFLIASLTDFYDGYIARRYGSVSKWGKFLDPLADKVLILSALVCLAVLGYVAVWMVVVIAVRDVLITILRAYAFMKEKPVVTMQIAQWKTASQAIVVYFILAYMLADISLQQKNVYWAGFEWIQRAGIINILVFAVTVLTVLTGVIYLYNNRDHTRELVSGTYRFFRPGETEP